MAETYESVEVTAHITNPDDLVRNYEQEHPEEAQKFRDRAKIMGRGNPMTEKDAYRHMILGRISSEKAKQKAGVTPQAEPSPLDKCVVIKDANIVEAKKASEAVVPAEAASLQPTVAQSAQVFDMSSYTERAKAEIEAEADSNNTVRATLRDIRNNVSERIQQRAKAKNEQYVQELKAATGDNTTINSTVPVSVEQIPETVQNDDVLEETTVSIKEAYMMVEQSTLDPSEAEAAYAALEAGDAATVEQIIHDHDAKAQVEAQYLAQLDATKQVATELAKEAGKEFSKNLMADIMSGKLSAKKFLNNFDYFMSNLGDSIGSYVGAALSGIPGPNNCASQTLTNIGLGVSSMLGAINTAATVANGLATFGANLADSIADIYAHGPELLISMAETTAQTAAQTTMMALRNASKTNCTAALAYGTIKGAVAVGETTIRAGITVATKAKELQGAAENLVRVVEKKDFVGDLKRKVKLHPAVRERNRFINSDKLDLATYSRLTRNGDKFARAMLGVDAQNRYSSVKKHSVSVGSSIAGFRRLNYSTTAECNRWNLYNKQTFSLAGAF